MRNLLLVALLFACLIAVNVFAAPTPDKDDTLRVKRQGWDRPGWGGRGYHDHHHGYGGGGPGGRRGPIEKTTWETGPNGETRVTQVRKGKK